MHPSIQTHRAPAAIFVAFFHLAGYLAKDKYRSGVAAPCGRLFSFGWPAGAAFMEAVLTWISRVPQGTAQARFAAWSRAAWLERLR